MSKSHDAEKISSSTVARCCEGGNHHRHFVADGGGGGGRGGSITMKTPYVYLVPAEHCGWFEAPAFLIILAVVVVIIMVTIVVTLTPKTVANTNVGSTNGSSSCFSPRHHTPDSVPLEYNNNNNNNTTVMTIPFIVLRPPNWKKLQQTLVTFRQERHAALEQLSRYLEVTLQSEQDYDDIDDCVNDNDVNEVPRRRRRGNRSPTTSSHPLLLSQSIQDHMDRLAAIYEQDSHVLEQHILVPFSYIQVLPAPPTKSPQPRQWRSRNDPSNQPLNHDSLPPQQSNGSSTRRIARIQMITRAVPNMQMPSYYYDDNHDNNNNDNETTTNTTTAMGTSEFAAVYDSAGQVVAHLVRDWSREGLAIRSSLYSWCGDHVRKYVPPAPRHPRAQLQRPQPCLPVVLVPGAGLGRLAWELSQLDGGGYAVQAVEPSGSMAAAAAAKLAYVRGSTKQSLPLRRLHPYASDAFTNEVGR